MIDTLALWGTLYFYATCSLLGTLYIYLMMPETETRTLGDIEVHFADKSKTFVTNIEKADKRRRMEEKEREGYDNYGLEREEERYISRF